jgi:PPM family protein phosphatase
LFIVADGVGGHQAGEVASQIACQVVQDRQPEEGLEGAVQAAHKAVLEAAAAGEGRAGMATTVVAVHLVDGAYQIAWVGDSRAYLWDSQLKLLTRDHSLVESLLARGEISFAEARHHPKRNVIAQALGLPDTESLQVGTNSGTLLSGQRLLLCSDGLNDAVDTPEIARLLGEGRDAQECVEQLLAAVVTAQGRDNITVVVVEGRAERNPAAPVAEPAVVWTFDVDTGAYSGLPEQPQAKVLKIAPRAPAASEASRPAPPRAAWPPWLAAVVWTIVISLLVVAGFFIGLHLDLWSTWQ